MKQSPYLPEKRLSKPNHHAQQQEKSGQRTIKGHRNGPHWGIPGLYFGERHIIMETERRAEMPKNFLIRIGDEIYLLESQSYDDGCIRQGSCPMVS